MFRDDVAPDPWELAPATTAVKMMNYVQSTEYLYVRDFPLPTDNSLLPDGSFSDRCRYTSSAWCLFFYSTLSFIR